jgi:uncharacterized protein YbjT (DUF2867 family)
LNVVTGVFSYTGSYIARNLLASGEPVKTLSRRPDPSHPLAERVAFAQLRFDDEAALTRDLRGASTVYNTYWIRFPRGDVTWATVLENTRVLLRAAGAAGVRRFVQFSVTNASEGSPFGYFRYKALVEREVRTSGLSYAIVRPTLIFGRKDILVSNIAWALRRFPFFVIPGAGDYRVQPVSAHDVAALAVEAAGRSEDLVVDAAGPDIYTFAELVEAIGAGSGSRSRLIRCPPSLVLSLAGIVGRIHGDVLVTQDELRALMASLLVSPEAPSGRLRFEDWLAENGEGLGSRFISERNRNWGAR